MLMREENQSNLVVLAVAAVALAAYAAQRMRSEKLRLSLVPVATRPALLLTIVSAAAYVAVESFWAVHILSAMLCAAGTFGLIRLYSPNRSVAAGLLLLTALPLGAYLDIYVGFPVRLLTAGLIAQMLAASGIAVAPAETLLVLENGIAHVDLPCSGVQSLWIGLLFFLAATCCERPALGWRWTAIGVLSACALLTANLVRVAILIVLTLILRLPQVAEVAHVPLGIVGFIACCALTLVLLRRERQRRPNERALDSKRLIAPAHAQAALLTTIVALGSLYQPAPRRITEATPLTITLPPSVRTAIDPLTNGETNFFERHESAHAVRQRFQWQDLSGSLLLSFSPAWHGHHNPEHCLAGNGVRVGDRRTLLIGDFPVRAVALEDSRTDHATTAVYWLQSPSHTTDEIAARIWADLIGRERRWMLVSIVFDRAADAAAAETQPLLTLIHAAVAAALEESAT